MANAFNPYIFLPVFVLVFTLTVQSAQADVYESVDDPKAKAFGNRVCTNPECTIVAANFINHGNDKIKPCDNFAQFTCDRYQLFKNLIPLHESEHAIIGRLKLLLKTPPSPEDKPYHTLMKTFYDKCMKQHKESPMSSFKALLDEIGGWPLLKLQNWIEFDTSFEEYIADIQKKHEAPILFKFFVTSNPFPGNTDEHRLHLTPATTIQTKAAFLPTIAKALSTDHSSLVADFKDVFSKIGNKRQELLDDPKPRTIKIGPLGALKKLLPNFDLVKYARRLFDGVAEVNDETTVSIYNLEYFEDIHTLFVDKRIFANYAVSALATKFFLPKMSCIILTRDLFKYPLSQLYVKNHFDHDAVVPRVAEMIKLMKEELHKIIKKSDWLDDTTRSNAFKKLDHMKADIGYPENLFDDAFVSDVYNIPPSESSESYSDLEARIQRRLRIVELLKISKKIDRTTWEGKASIIKSNAHNAAVLNKIRICLITLIMVPSDKLLPIKSRMAMIMKGASMMKLETNEIGGKKKRLNKAKSECLVKQYTKENYDGQLSLGKNIADNGGMKLAFNAYKKLMASRGNVPEPAQPGFEEFTPESLFFMAYANTWCNAGRRNPDDEHPPGETRLKVVAQNMKAFSETFACPKNAPMNPDLRCSVW